MATLEKYLELALTDVKRGDIKQAFRRRKLYLSNNCENTTVRASTLDDQTRDKPERKPQRKLQLKRTSSSNKLESTIAPPTETPSERHTNQAPPVNPPAPPPVPLTAARTKLKEQIDRLYELFWWHDSAFMQRKIDAVSAVDQPDLQARIERLKLLNTARLCLNRGERFHNRDARLIMKRIVEIFFDNSAGAVDMKEEIIQLIAQLQDPREIKKALIALKSETPEVYQMEKDFIDNLYVILESMPEPTAALKANDSDKEPTATETGCGCIIILVVIAGIVKIFFFFTGN